MRPAARIAALLLLASGVARAQPAPPAYPPGYVPPPPGYAPPPPGYVPPPPGYVPPPGYPPPPGYVEGAPMAPAPERPSTFQARVSMAAALRALYEVSIYGADVEIGLGAQPTDHVAFYANIGFFFGRTAAGLLTIGFRPGMMVEGVFDRFRLGGGIEFGSISIRRVTNPGSFTDFTIGPRINASIDLTRWGRRGGLYLGVSGAFDFLAESDTRARFPLMAEGQLLLGARF